MNTIQLGKGRTGNEEMNRLVESFLADRAAKFNFKPSSITKRREELRKFLLYLEITGVKHFQDVDLKTLDKFRFCLFEHDLGLYSIEAHLRAVQIFFRFLKEEKIIPRDPAARMEIPKAPVILGPILSDREIERLFALPDLSTAIGIRDRAFMEMLYSTGMMRGEARVISLRDVDLERATVIVKDKCGKQRILPLGKQALQYLRLYIKESRPVFLPKFMAATDDLWTTCYHGCWSDSGICNTMRRYAQKAGLIITAHTLRRTCAMNMLRTGAHPETVVKMLGFSGLVRLGDYLQATIPDMMNTHGKSEK